VACPAAVAAVLAGERRGALLLGDMRARLADVPDASLDACVTDAPYGLSAEPDIVEVLTHWLAGDPYIHSDTGGFMGKTWDAFVPGPEYWRIVYRKLKPGAHLLVMAATRTWDLMSLAIRLAGFENRDTIGVHGLPALVWTYGKSMPHSLNVSKAIDKAAGAPREVVGTYKVSGNALTSTARKGGTFGVGVPNSPAGELPITVPATDDAKEWDGWGTTLKPMWEVVLVFRKPLAEKTVVAQVLKTGTGALNIDACRLTPDAQSGGTRDGEASATKRYTDVGGTDFANTPGPRGGSAAGRHPPNQVFCHLPDCVRVGTRQVKTGTAHEPAGKPMERTVYGATNTLGRVVSFGDADGNETIPAYECAAGCRVAALDAQSGTLRPRGNKAASSGGGGMFGHAKVATGHHARADLKASGGASRFFPQFEWEPGEFEAAFRFIAKASTKERNAGLPEGHRNRHATVKPKALFRWLLRLVVPAGGVVLDPFVGSGTTAVVAAEEGFRFVACELEEPSYVTAQMRIRAAYDAPAAAGAAP